MSRDEFWRMDPEELWWLVAANTPRRMIGEFTEDEAEVLYQDAKRVKAERDHGAG